MASWISSLVKYRSQQHQDQQLKRLNRGICCPESALIRSVRAAISRLYFEHGHAFVRLPPLRSVSALLLRRRPKRVQVFEAVDQCIGLDQRSVFEINFRILNHRRSVLSSISRPLRSIALQWKCLCIKVEHKKEAQAAEKTEQLLQLYWFAFFYEFI